MKTNLSGFIDNVIFYLLLFVAALTPLLFFNQTTEFFDIPKLTFLVVTTVLLLGLWIFSWIIKGKITFNKTPLDIPLLILLASFVISVFFSPARYVAILGNFPNVHNSAVAWITYILLYFVTVSQLKDLSRIKTFLYVLYGSAVFVSLVSLLSFFSLFLPFDFAKGINFSLTGSTFSTVAFLMLLIPFPLLSLLNPNKYLSSSVSFFTSILFSLIIALIGSLPSHILLAFIYSLCLFLPKPQQSRKTLALFAIPVITTVLTFILAYLPFPGNFIQPVESGFPKEIQLPLDISWKITASVFRDSPFVGSGPGSYLFNFTSYKPVEFNQQKFWSFSFDTAYNEYLQILGTLGLFGLIGIIYLSFVILNSVLKNILLKTSELDSPEDSQDKKEMLLPAMSMSGLVAILLLFIHAATVISVIVTFFIFAALMMSRKSVRENVTDIAIGIQASTSDNKRINIFPLIIFIIFLAGALPVLYYTYKFVLADYYHRQALNQANKSGTLTYQYLQKSEALNPYNDLYRVDLAQTNFALANALASQKNTAQTGQTQVALSDKDKQTIQTLLSQAINEGRAAVALSPRSSRNWEVLASIYRNITGVAQNALTFSLDAYGRAIQRDPLNPILRVNVGGIYYSAKNYDMAVRFFNDAISLKSDYANAYYNLAIALRDKGDFPNAKLAAEQTVGLLQKDTTTNDYKTASALLSELTVKVAATAKNTQTGTGTSANETSALQNPNLPKINVSDLNNPPEISTPSAVTKTAPKPTPIILTTSPTP